MPATERLGAKGDSRYISCWIPRQERMMTKSLFTLLLILLLWIGGPGMAYAAGAAGYTFTTLDYPGAATTVAAGMSGNIVYGGYIDKNSANHGFIYNLESKKYTSIDATAAGNANGQGTFINNVSNGLVIGSYLDSNNLLHGFTCNIDGTNCTVIDNAEAGNQPGEGTTISCIEGDAVFGSYSDPGNHAFIYNMPTQKFTTFDALAAGQDQIEQGTFVDAVAGSVILGHYVDTNTVTHGYLYDMESRKFTMLDDPLAGKAANQTQGTFPSAISQNSVVGYYVDAKGVYHAFIYDIPSQKFTDLDVPGAGADKGLGTYATAITDGPDQKVIGSYTDKNGVEHAFVYDVNDKTFTTLDDPAAGTKNNQGTSANSIAGGAIIGGYTDPADNTHGFVATKN